MSLNLLACSAGLLALVATPAVAQTVSTYTIPVPRPTQGYVYEGWEAYNPTQPVPEPGPPNPLPALLDFPVPLNYNGTITAGPEVLGSFLGLSIEMSLVEEIIGRNASWVRPQFLNLMSALKERGGPPILRTGGNSQERAALVDEIAGGMHSTERIMDSLRTMTGTPRLQFTKDIFDAMKVVTDLLDIKWYLGAPFNTTVNETARLQIMEVAEPILGDSIIAWQIGNEPDLFDDHGKRPSPYTEDMYLAEFASVLRQRRENPNIKHEKNIAGPSFCECSSVWTAAEFIKNRAWLETFKDDISTISSLHYPAQNCPKENRKESLLDETIQLFSGFAKHYGDQAVTSYYTHFAELLQITQEMQIPIILIETNTAACNGFLGLSDSFLAALWTLDLGFHLASIGFRHGMIHLGGQQSYYNPFVHPPWNATEPFMWTVGPPMYAILMVSEALGPSNKARVADLEINNKDPNMAGYVIYENNRPVRVILINYMTDSGQGNLAITARLTVEGATTVRTRELKGDRLTSKLGFSYAGQTWGGYFESDGLLRGKQVTNTVACQNGVCPIKVPAPGAMVVFLTDDLIHDEEKGDSIQTWGTSQTTKMLNTAYPEIAALETSNGLSAEEREKLKYAKTSRGSSADSVRVSLAAAATAILAVLLGAGLFRA